MFHLRFLARASMMLGMVALIALLLAHLALVDIWHHEDDLAVEWRVLQICAAIIAASLATAIATASKVLRW